jgi:hypothetical protein
MVPETKAYYILAVEERFAVQGSDTTMFNAYSTAGNQDYYNTILSRKEKKGLLARSTDGLRIDQTNEHNNHFVK